MTDDPSIARRVRELKDQGRATRGTGGADHHPVAGFNFKLTNVQAAIGLVQLDRLDQRLAHLRTLEDWYAEELHGAEHDVALVGGDRAGGEHHGWWTSVPGTETHSPSISGVEASIRANSGSRLHTHPPFAAPEESFPNATLVSARGLWLPSALSLTREHVASVGASVREFAQTPRAAALS